MKQRGYSSMLLDRVEVIQAGDRNGNNRIFRRRLSSGREIIGLATENFYGGDWDLGPTWNYWVGPERPFLVDTGRYGMGGRLLAMMGQVGLKGQDLDFALISHGHEDHDGGLMEIVAKTGVRVKAQALYDRLIRIYPQDAPSSLKEAFSASCWHCFMPESFTQVHCLEYHKKRNELQIEGIADSDTSLGEGVQAYHLPGHSPDSLALLIDKEAILVGDIVLPEITPHPSQEAFFKITEKVIPPHHRQAQTFYGLKAYLRSLKRLKEIGQEHPHLLVLPGHRLFYNNQWHEIDLRVRVAEVIEHHIQRGGDILTILKDGPRTPEEVARRHFDPKLLKGFGINLAVSEILSHAEFLLSSRDILRQENGSLLGLGSHHFEKIIRDELGM
jgi:glyoxylase-like metal-dependent hydrolase (beta-lactamase superfamily II)